MCFCIIQVRLTVPSHSDILLLSELIRDKTVSWQEIHDYVVELELDGKNTTRYIQDMVGEGKLERLMNGQYRIASSLPI